MSCSNDTPSNGISFPVYLPGLLEASELRPLCQQYKWPTACQWRRGTPELSARIFQSPGPTGYSALATFASSRPKEKKEEGSDSMFTRNSFSAILLQSK